MGEDSITGWQLIELLVIFGAPVYALAAAVTYAALRRARRLPVRPVVLVGGLLAAALVALPLQLAAWWALGALPGVPSALLGLTGIALVPSSVAALVCFTVAGRLLARTSVAAA